RRRREKRGRESLALLELARVVLRALGEQLVRAEPGLQLVEVEHAVAVAQGGAVFLEGGEVGLHGAGEGAYEPARIDGEGEAEPLQVRARQDRRAAALHHVRQEGGAAREAAADGAEL